MNSPCSFLLDPKCGHRFDLMAFPSVGPYYIILLSFLFLVSFSKPSLDFALPTMKLGASPA